MGGLGTGTRPLGAFRRAAACSLIAIVLLSGCSPQTLQAPQAASVATEQLEKVSVERGNISQVVTTAIIAKARPTFAVTAPTTGKVLYVKNFAEGMNVTANEVIGWQDETFIRAPAAGVVNKILVADSTSVHENIPVVEIAYEGFGAIGTVPVESAYRLSKHPELGKLQFVAGPGLTECTPVPAAPSSDLMVTEDTQDLGETRINIVCLIADPDGLVDGLPGKIGITGKEAKDTLTLPITALSGLADSGQVARVNDDGSISEVNVQLGASDGSYIEIIYGLSEGDEVLRYGPTLTPRLGG